MRAIASLSVLVLFLFPALASAEETLRAFSWKERGEQADYVVVSSDGAPRTVTILAVSDRTVPAFGLPALRKRYEEVELRRMRALDAR